MASVTAHTIFRMEEVENECVVDAHLSGDNLILERFDASTIDAGAVKGPTGFTGDTGPAGVDGEALSVGSYIPTWFATSFGSGGNFQNIGYWTFTGGPDVGDVGLLSLRVAARYGSGFTTFPSTQVTLSIPTAFNWVNDGDLSASSHRMSTGKASFLDSSAGLVYNGFCCKSSTTNIAVWAVFPSDQLLRDLSTTVPFTWAADDGICLFMGGMRAIRV